MTNKFFIVAMALLSMSLIASTAVVKPVVKLDETINAITETPPPNETESRGMVEVGNNGMVITLNPGPMLAGLFGLLAITGIGLGIAAAIAIPLGVVFGTGGGNDYDDYDGFGNFARVWTAPPSSGGYGGAPAASMSSYSTYSQRSLETMQPILETLANGLRKYSEDGKITYKF